MLSLYLLLVSFLSVACCERSLSASSLVTCMDNSMFSASQFNVIFTPANRTLQYDVTANLEINGYVYAEIDVYAYGIKIISKEYDPCKNGLTQLCPVSPGQFSIQSNSQVSSDVVGDLPGVAFTVPDIDATVYVQVYDSANRTQVACIRVDITNGKTVDHVAVKWVTAVISGIGLLTSAVLSSWGSSYSAAHIAANAVMLFSYFQSIVIVSMMAVQRLPPIASSWAQNLSWSVGLISIRFMQKIFRWYVQSTGGTPSTNILYPTVAVMPQKRDVAPSLTLEALDSIKEFGAHLHGRAKDYIYRLSTRGVSVDGFVNNRFSFRDTVKALGELSPLRKRGDGINSVAESSSTLLVLRGIKRVAYQADVDYTSAVVTSFTFFVLICIAVTILFCTARGVVLCFQRSKYSPKVQFFAHTWLQMLKGTLLRILFIALPQLLIFSLWEFVERDSPAVIVLAILFLLTSLGVIILNSVKVWLIGKKSIEIHQTPAYLLFSDSEVLNKYGFLYIQFEANHYYFAMVMIAYIFLKSIFMAFAQASGKTQAMVFFIIEIIFLAVVSWRRPFMDKPTNIINIVTQSIILLNTFFFLFFSNIFGAPYYVSAIMGVIFFVVNAAYSSLLLIYTLVTCALVLFTKNPDSRYKPAKDDRASFIQENAIRPNAAGEFTALGAAAKADHDRDSVLHDPFAGGFEKRPDSSYSFPSISESFPNSAAFDNTSTPNGGGGHSRADSQAKLNDSPKKSNSFTMF